ncbi:OLC1v1019957C1 [Oldenlandia corymbosa var. corymbosa]|uniref:OLC1v1019957C1 n=1 Tax=Oldenlandia corymbosa var. corymbosa TaxID=529605 RepID=A0AAV1EFC1_OLDCO|nr:OLC1v1019957C1 [Oldenlandia corymbosa var. corymbosa]
MASLCTISFFTVILVLQSCSASSSNFSSIFSPFFGDVCKSSNPCGKGTCKSSNETTFGYECVCDAGWKQTRSEKDNDLKFLPCVVPNCTLNYSCVEAPSPAPHVNRSGQSVFDPCFWTDCGGGTCNKTSPFEHTCQCQEGYYNILNVSAFPCYRDCALGADCTSLGINLNNRSSSSSSSSPPNLSENSQNHASTISRFPMGHFSWLILSLLSLALVPWI